MSHQILQRPALVLNRNWQPIHIATVARVLIMVYRGTARVVDPADYQMYDWKDWSRLQPAAEDLFVRTVNSRLRIPEVVVLAYYDGLPNANVPFSRRNIYKRDRHTCQYCGAQPPMDELTIDHVIPRSHGGTSTWENCVLACLDCNKRKADRTPAQAGMRLRRVPQRPAWRPFYSWCSKPIESWQRFLGEAYWNITLENE